jgi:hypothetical protein
VIAGIIYEKPTITGGLFCIYAWLNIAVWEFFNDVLPALNQVKLVPIFDILCSVVQAL